MSMHEAHAVPVQWLWCCCSDRWGKKSYPASLCRHAFTSAAQLRSMDVSTTNNRICQPCWERHRDPHDEAGWTDAHVVRPISSPLPHSTHSSLQPSALFPLPHLLCPLLLLSPLCPLLLQPQPASSLPFLPSRSSPAIHYKYNTRPAPVPLQSHHSPITVPPQSQHSPIPVPPQSHNSPTPAT